MRNLMRIRFAIFLAMMVLAVGGLTLPVDASAAAAASAAHKGVIVFQTSSGGAIYLVNPDGTNLRHLTNGMDPALSPDGRSVAFTRWSNSNTGEPGSLWTINIDGTDERLISRDLHQPKSPTWSPDGRSIVVSTQDGGAIYDERQCFPLNGGTRVPIPPGAKDITTDSGQLCFTAPANPYWSLRLLDVATGAFQDLPRDRHYFAPTWDPANAWHIVFDDGDRGLMNLDTVRQTTWSLDTDLAQRAPIFSPDGKKIATTYRQVDHFEIHVMNADGTGRVRLTETPPRVIADEEIKGLDARSWNNAAPAWSPDGSQIAFVTDRNGPWEIWVMNADGSGQHALLPAATAAKLNIQYNGMDERVISWR
jgi:dipeptidyl aminopeptidase/acylaminoacyl peptidase